MLLLGVAECLSTDKSDKKLIIINNTLVLFCSFTWSFEKINLSMVQVITGHLVKSYDEEFRTLYARSSVPVELCPSEGSFPQLLPKSHLPQKIDRKDHLRHSLDTVYRKTCERTVSTRDLEDKLFEEEPNELGPLIKNGITAHNQMHHFQPAEAANFLKRHSYAGERQGRYVHENMWPRASNWNISRETGNIMPNYPRDDYLQVAKINRGQNIRQCNGEDRQVLAMQHNMPGMENTSKSFMRSLRIESYLQNNDVPFGDSCDYLDQFEPLDKANSYLQGRMRSSLVFRSTIPEQMEQNRPMNNSSTGISSLTATNTPLHYSPKQWNSTPAAEKRLSNEELMLKRQSLQILDDNWNNTSYGLGREFYHSAYANLGRTRSGHMMTNPDILTDSWHKRHSMVDPRSNTEYEHESPAHMYGAFARMQVNRNTMGFNTQNGGYRPNLNEDQRSVSEYDVKSVSSTTNHNTTIWQEPPSRTVSAAALQVNSKDSMTKSNSTGSHRFIKKSSKKLKSLLNIPEKKEDSVGTMETPSMKSSGSTITLTAEDEEAFSDSEGPQHFSDSVRSSFEPHRSQLGGNNLKSSKPLLRFDEHRNSLQNHLPKMKKGTLLDRSTRPSLDKESWNKNQGAETRLYSRFEPFNLQEKKNSLHFSHTSHSHPKSLPKGEAVIEHNLTRAARTHHENKLEKFFHRVGNLIHKNK